MLFARQVVRQVVARPLALTTTRAGAMSMSPENINAAWVDFFDKADYWDLRRGVRELMTDDAIPTPEICQVHITPLRVQLRACV